MARQHFEDQFQKALKNRELNPSPGNWDKLASQLDKAENKRRPAPWFIGIAATLIGGILILGSVLTADPVLPEGNEVVTVPSEEIMTEEKTQTERTIPTPDSNTQIAESTEEVPVQKEQNDAKPPIVKEPETSIASVENTQEDVTEQVEEQEKLINDPVLSHKLEEVLVLAEVSENDFSAEAGEDEVDALLAKAAAEIELDKKNSAVAQSIDPEDLLFEVEMELEQSFREKVFQVLKEGYLKARTAVVNGNSQ